MSMTKGELKKWSEIIAAIDNARLDDLTEWARISDFLRDNLTREERRFFIAQLQLRMDRLNELLSLPDTTGAAG